MISLVLRAEHTTMAKSVAVLPEAVGTRSVEILQSYTRGSRAPRLAKVKPQIHALFSIHNHAAKNYLSLRMISRAVINFVSVMLRHIFHPHQESQTCMWHNFLNTTLLVCAHYVFGFELTRFNLAQQLLTTCMCVITIVQVQR